MSTISTIHTAVVPPTGTDQTTPKAPAAQPTTGTPQFLQQGMDKAFLAQRTAQPGVPVSPTPDGKHKKTNISQDISQDLKDLSADQKSINSLNHDITQDQKNLAKAEKEGNLKAIAADATDLSKDQSALKVQVSDLSNDLADLPVDSLISAFQGKVSADKKSINSVKNDITQDNKNLKIAEKEGNLKAIAADATDLSKDNNDLKAWQTTLSADEAALKGLGPDKP